MDACRVGNLTLQTGGTPHDLELRRGNASWSVQCRWLVDASGRASLLKKRLDLAQPNRHDISAAWFRVDHVLDPDAWSPEPAWRSRLQAPRRLSTNHIMGEGYWVRLIPLVNDRTSVGIVVDGRLHPFSRLHTLDKAMAWLTQYEPQCASVVRTHIDRRMDFMVLKDCSYGTKQLFAADRWCLTGEA